jgi:hypothetical protein
MKKEIHVPSIKKLKPDTRIVGVLDKTNYVVTKDGRVFRELKPTTVNSRHYYNVLLEGRLRRVARTTLLEEIKNV